MENKLSGWIILKDHVSNSDDEYNRTGKQSKDWNDDCKTIAIPFRVYDDDKILYYEGLLVDDDWCNGQQRVLDWSMNDAGCTEIKVKKNDKWVTEIG